MKNLTLGKYVPFNSLIHRLDPRAKLSFAVVLMIAVFLQFPSYSTSFILLGFLFIFTAISLWISKMSLKMILSSLKTMWIVIAFLLIVYALLPTQNPTLPLLFKLGSWEVYYDALLNALKIILRLFIMLGLTMVLTATTKPLDLTYALEWFFTPLKVIKFPASEVALTISIALRFIPTLLDDTNRILKAQESRGVDFSKGNLFKRISSLTSLVVPLFVSAFSRSEDLANAMECRCFDPEAKRTRYRVMKWSFKDTICVILGHLILAAFIYLSVTKTDILGLFGVTSL